MIIVVVVVTIIMRKERQEILRGRGKRWRKSFTSDNLAGVLK